MKAWLSDVIKIGFGVSLGFVMLVVLAFALEDWVLPAFRILSMWLFGAGE